MAYSFLCKLVTRVCHRARNFATGVAILLSCLVVAVTSAADPATSSRTDPQVSATAYRAGTAAIIRPATAIADFDADGRPDLAIADRYATSSQTQYSVELKLSRGSSQTLRFWSQNHALAVVAIDVDHDLDIDIVFTPLLSGHIATVLLNDGAGHFERGRIERPGADLIALPTVASTRARDRVSAALLMPRLPPIDGEQPVGAIGAPLVLSSEFETSAFRRAPSRSTSPRGPPVSVSL